MTWYAVVVGVTAMVAFATVATCARALMETTRRKYEVEEGSGPVGP